MTNPNPNYKKNIRAGIQIPTNLDPALRSALLAMKQHLEAAMGWKGPKGERFATLNDLKDAGLITFREIGNRSEIVATSESTGAATATAASTVSTASGATFNENNVSDRHGWYYDAGSGTWMTTALFNPSDNLILDSVLSTNIPRKDTDETVTGAWTFGTVTLTSVTVSDLTFTNAAELTADLDLFTSALQGLAPASGGGTDNFLRADGTWAEPPGGAGGLVYADASVPGGNTVANTTTETTFASTYTIPANTLALNTVLRIKVAGVYSTDATVAPTLTLRFDIGGTTMLSQAITLDTGEANAPWYAEVIVICSTSGASGAVEHHGVLTVDNIDYQLSATSTTTVDTTGTLAVEVTAQWGAADVDDTVTMREMAVYIEDAASPITSDHGGLDGLADDDHTQYTLISSGAGVPASTPGRVGEIYIDTTNDEAYVSTDTVSSADWDQITGAGGASDHGALTGLTDDDHTQYSIISSGAGVPGTTPSRVGAIYVDTTNDNAYVATDTASSADWDQITGGGGSGPAVSSGSGEPTSTPASVGDIYIDTTDDHVWMATDTADSRGWSRLGKGRTSDQLPASADNADDEFDVGTSIDTAGTRRTSATAWTWVNQGTATANILHNEILELHAPQGTGNNLRMVVQSTPSTPWVYKAKVAVELPAANFHQAGLCLRDNTTGEVILFGWERTGSARLLQVKYYTDSTTFSSNPFSVTGFTILEYAQWYYFQIGDDGTNLSFSVSQIGADNSYRELWSAGRTAHLAAVDQIGVVSNANNASNGGSRTFVEWFRRDS